MKILVIGKNGQVASELGSLAHEYPDFEVILCDSTSCDITQKKQLHDFIASIMPEVVINCAAYTAVDQAENDQKQAFAVNHLGVLNLDEAAIKFGFKYIHLSTDYVFDGTSTQAYQVEDETKPLGVYGLSKRAGELVVLSSQADAIVIRTAWVYSSFGKNFVKTMLRLAETNDTVRVVNDQTGSPTYARDLARACFELLNKTATLSRKGKLYHFTNSGTCTWYEFAQQIFKESGSSCRAIPIPGSEYPTPAKRPSFSVLDTQKIQKDFELSIPDWKDALHRCIQKIKAI